MALLFMDGFDHYATADITKKWNSIVGSMTIFPIDGRRGGGAAGGNPSGSENLNKTLPGSYATLVFGLALKVDALVSLDILTLKESATSHLILRLNATGTLSVVRAASTVLGTSSTSLSTDAFYYIEIKATIHDTTGAVEVRVNGVTCLNLTGQDTRNAGTTGLIDNFVITGTSGTWRLDDFYVCDTSGTKNNDFLGDVRIDTLLPNADGTYSQFTPSTGTNHSALVDEATPNTTDYNDGATVGNRDSHQFTNLTSIASQIVYGVQVNAAIQKDDAGAKSACTFVRSGTTDGDAATAVLGTAQTYVSQIFETNPSGGVAWTEASVNAAEFGMKVTA